MNRSSMISLSTRLVLAKSMVAILMTLTTTTIVLIEASFRGVGPSHNALRAARRTLEGTSNGMNNNNNMNGMMVGGNGMGSMTTGGQVGMMNNNNGMTVNMMTMTESTAIPPEEAEYHDENAKKAATPPPTVGQCTLCQDPMTCMNYERRLEVTLPSGETKVMTCMELQELVAGFLGSNCESNLARLDQACCTMNACPTSSVDPEADEHRASNLSRPGDQMIGGITGADRERPTAVPTKPPSAAATTTTRPTKAPTKPPTGAPMTVVPQNTKARIPSTKNPTAPPTKSPTRTPVTAAPTVAPTKTPTKGPTPRPTTAAPVPQPDVGVGSSSSCVLCEGLGRGCLRYDTFVTFSRNDSARCKDVVEISDLLPPGSLCIGNKAELESACCPCLSTGRRTTAVVDVVVSEEDEDITTTTVMTRDTPQLHDADTNHGSAPGGRISDSTSN